MSIPTHRATVRPTETRVTVIVHRTTSDDREACKLAASSCGGVSFVGPTRRLGGRDGDRWEAVCYGPARWYNAVHMLRAHGYHVEVTERRCAGPA